MTATPSKPSKLLKRQSYINSAKFRVRQVAVYAGQGLAGTPHLSGIETYADRPLPLIWLSDRDSGVRVLDELATQLDAPIQRRVPHAHDDTTKEGAPDDIRHLLRKLSSQLAAPSFGAKRLSFRGYEFVDWLMQQDLSEVVAGDRPKEIIKRLRHRHRWAGGDNNSLDITVPELGPYLEFLIWLISWMPKFVFRAAVSGKIPGFGREYRWLMRQPYLSPRRSADFLGFAERLTEVVDNTRQPKNSDQIDKFLVNVFLEDLRRGYTRRRLEGRRCTAHPIMLIKNATADSAGYRLMQLINDVRNETRSRDPLLAVCASDHRQVPRAPAGNSEDSGSEIPKDDPAYDDEIYRTWVKVLSGELLARVDAA